MLPDLRARSGDTGGDRQPGAEDVGRERERAQRAPRRRDRPARRRGRPDDGLPGPRVGGPQGPPDGQGAQADEAAAVAVLDQWEAEVRERARAAGVRRGRGLDGDGRPRPAAPARPHARRWPSRSTGGLVAGRLTAIPGASDVFRGVDRVVRQRGQVRVARVSSGPVVNEPAAIEMAEGVQRLLGADVGLSLTGVAGPAEQDGVPVGTVCIGDRPAHRLARQDGAPRHAARAGPPVRRHQRPRPAAPPPPALRRDLSPRSVSPQRSQRTCCGDTERRSPTSAPRLLGFGALAPVAQLDRAAAF